MFLLSAIICAPFMTHFIWTVGCVLCGVFFFFFCSSLFTKARVEKRRGGLWYYLALVWRRSARGGCGSLWCGTQAGAGQSPRSCTRCSPRGGRRRRSTIGVHWGQKAVKTEIMKPQTVACIFCLCVCAGADCNRGTWGKTGLNLTFESTLVPLSTLITREFALISFRFKFN